MTRAGRFVFISICPFTGSTQAATPLAEAAKSMKVGEWREFKTQGLTKKMLYEDWRGRYTGGRCTSWTNELTWDPLTRTIPSSAALTEATTNSSIMYHDDTNTWTAEKNPPKELQKRGHGLGSHTYNHHTVTDDGVYYRMVHGYA